MIVHLGIVTEFVTVKTHKSVFPTLQVGNVANTYNMHNNA